MLIPRTIHYCWFGGNPLPEQATLCIESWKKYCPGYEIVEWDESNFDITCCAYVHEAYEAKKWAFVSDYARFWILYHQGGIYFDTDVEMIKTIDDILAEGSFMACETKNEIKKQYNVNPGLGVAAVPGLPLYLELLEDYQASHFVDKEGIMDQTTVVDHTTRILFKHGFDNRQDSIQKVAGIVVYPSSFFCPLDYNTGVLHITDNTRAIHWYSASWYGEQEKYAKRIRNKLSHLLPVFLSGKIAAVVAVLKYQGMNVLFAQVTKKIMRPNK